MAADYSDLIAQIVTLLKGDANLTGANAGATTNNGASLLAPFDPNGVSPTRANSIFYQRPPVPQPPTPCLVLAELDIAPAAQMVERPFAYASIPLVLYLYGAVGTLHPYEWELDNLFEPPDAAPPWSNDALDSSDWAITDIDTSRPWATVAVDEQATDSNGVFLEQKFKPFVITAASKNG